VDSSKQALHRFLRRPGADIWAPILTEEATDRVSRPVGFRHQPLAEPSVRLSPHSAPIRQTCRSC
jgi:hypothetical protein